MKSRRRFLKSLAAAPLVPAALVQTSPSPSPVPPPSPAATPSAALPPVPEDPMAQALAEASRVRFGAHWRPGDLEEVRKTIGEGLRAAGRLRRVKLVNADEPVTTFSALPPGVRLPPPPPAPRPAPRRRRGRSGRTT